MKSKAKSRPVLVDHFGTKHSVTDDAADAPSGVVAQRSQTIIILSGTVAVVSPEV